MITAAGTADAKFFLGERVAAVRRVSETTCVWRGSQSLQRHRNECPGKREQQQKSGGRTLHVSEYQNPTLSRGYKQKAGMHKQHTRRMT
ncbi:MAG TPA: hypothetical protein VGS27_16075 [Candidatus Sulfotelmatobacter sp.]|nr:hypothetical protein [Candidatus Sulfotelmatobacter sp.]